MLLWLNKVMENKPKIYRNIVRNHIEASVRKTLPYRPYSRYSEHSPIWEIFVTMMIGVEDALSSQISLK